MSRSRHGRNWTERGVISNPRGFHKPEEPATEKAATPPLPPPEPERDPQLPHHPLDCPDPLGLHCQDASKAIVRKITGAPRPDPDEIRDYGLRAGEPLSLVEQSQERAEGYLGEPS